MERIREFILEHGIDRKTIYKSILVIVILISSIGIYGMSKPYNMRVKDSQKSESKVVKSELDNSTIVVDISGEVSNPGVYKMKGKVRLYEVIEKAGGLKSEANLDSINQARYIDDGEKIVIPSLNNNSQLSNSAEEASSGLVNINTASKEELKSLPGVGEVTANKIIDYRKNKRFADKEDLKNVSGIGAATFSKLEELITV